MVDRFNALVDALILRHPPYPLRTVSCVPRHCSRRVDSTQNSTSDRSRSLTTGTGIVSESKSTSLS